jgi:hypothetical protein
VRHVAVYGGGNTAMDAARVARRLGAQDAVIVYRRTREQMPAHDEEATEAEREGIRINWLRTITAFNGPELRVEVMKLDDSGNPQPTGRFETLAADTRRRRLNRRRGDLRGRPLQWRLVRHRQRLGLVVSCDPRSASGDAVPGFTVRDDAGRVTRVKQRRIVAMHLHHVGAMETTFSAQNWAGRLEVRSVIDGDIQNQGVARYRDLSSCHLEVTETSEVSNDSVLIVVGTVQSRIRVAVSVRNSVSRHEPARNVERKVIKEGCRIGHDIAVELTSGQSVTVEKVACVLMAVRRGRLGVDLIAVLSLGGTLFVGEYLAGALIAVMSAGGRALDAAPPVVRRVHASTGCTRYCACISRRKRRAISRWRSTMDGPTGEGLHTLRKRDEERALIVRSALRAAAADLV